MISPEIASVVPRFFDGGRGPSHDELTRLFERMGLAEADPLCGDPSLTIGKIYRVTTEPGLELDPAISPDGRAVAYAAGTPGHMRIYVRQIAGGRMAPLTEDDGSDGQREIRARVAVRNGIHVEVVDAPAVALEGIEGTARELPDPLEVAQAEDLFTSWIRTSTSATRRPVRRSTS